MDFQILTLYAVVSFFYIISPGPAIVLAAYNGATGGMRSVYASSLGNILGLLVLSSLSISGLSAILLTSTTLFVALKLIGAAYLIYLGLKQIRSSNTKAIADNKGGSSENRPPSSYFREGFLVAATNPKPILFFAALFPQFLNTSLAVFPQFVIMTLMFMLFSLVSLSTYGYLAFRAKTALSNSRISKWFARISGGLFIAMGASLTQLKNEA